MLQPAERQPLVVRAPLGGGVVRLSGRLSKDAVRGLGLGVQPQQGLATAQLAAPTGAALTIGPATAAAALAVPAAAPVAAAATSAAATAAASALRLPPAARAAPSAAKSAAAAAARDAP